MFLSVKKSVAALAIVAGLSSAALSVQAAETYKFDTEHTSVVFAVSHLGFSNFQGRFGGIDGELVLDRDAPANSSLTVTIDLTAVDSGVAALDGHLQTPDFFNTAEFPTATFKSTSVELTGDKTAKVTGDLTLHGVTSPVTLDVTLNGEGAHPMSGLYIAGFSATGTVTRSAFGMNYLVPAVGDDVELRIESEWVRQ
ncbi:YceI family protein [Thalassospira sp.]|uniref:YceI family protein n=1 Tax=Thalassospira sp. TaxID=1912094 RepID=UPI0027329BA0|nr:YceI family protein [Thalassospira sp.]MDP2697032.1 YceI family protein [Thalassospira sp.]